MNIYKYFLQKNGSFIPRTPNSALAGIKKGLLPIESFVSLSLFLYSPFGTPGKLKTLSDRQEHQRLQELERILSKKNINLETEVLLIYTLNKLVEHHNPEIALFAAESINSIENRYNKRIYELKESIKIKAKKEEVKDIIRLLYNYGYINRGKDDIQLFYYNESLSYFKYIENDKKDITLYILKIRMLNNLKEYNLSREVVNNLNEDIVFKWERLLIVMEIEFEARNFDKIYTLVKDIDEKLIPIEFCERIKLWKN